MKRRFSILACVIALALAMQASFGLFYSASAQGAGTQSQGAAGLVSLIVELESDPVVYHELEARAPGEGFRIESIGTAPDVDFDAASARAHEAQLEVEHQNFKARALQISPGLRVRTELRKLGNAVSVEVPASDVAAIAKMPGVKRVELVKEMHITLDASVSLINAPALYERLGGAGIAGDGVKVAILDTGIDISNPLFSDAGFTAPEGFPKFNNDNARFTNNKVIAAKSFVNGSQTADDENGHGTHVAGIATGSLNAISPVGSINGVAPRAYVGNYRVFGKTGSGSTDFIASALEAAVADGFDVINMSFGASASSTLDFFAERVEAAVASGKVIVVSAGNAGQGGVGDEMTIGTPGIAPHAITVAATGNARELGPVITVIGPQPVSSNLVSIGSVSGNTVALDNNIASMQVVEVSQQNRGCGALEPNSLAGKIALVERGNCAFSDKVNAAAAAGAKGVVIFNKDISEGEDGGETLIFMDVAGTNIPSVFVRRSDGLALRDFVRTNPSTTVSIAPLGAIAAPADWIASFSSRGPSAPGALKPDISAPGVEIYSGAARSVPEGAQRTVTDPSGFTAINGTSQAAPHVAGAAALLKQLHPSWTPEQIKSAFISSASDAFTTPGGSTRVGVLTGGAGRIDVNRAALVAATFSPSNLSFGVNKLKKKTVTRTIDLNVTSELEGVNTFTIGVEQLDPGDGLTVTPSVNSVTLTRGQSAAVTITIEALKRAEKRDYTGFILVTDQSGQTFTLRVPYWARYRKKG